MLQYFIVSVFFSRKLGRETVWLVVYSKKKKIVEILVEIRVEAIQLFTSFLWRSDDKCSSMVFLGVTP